MKLKHLLLAAFAAIGGGNSWAQEVTWPLAKPSTTLTDIGITTSSVGVTMDANGGWFYLLNQSGNYAALSSDNVLATSASEAEPVFIDGQTQWESEVNIKTSEGYLYMPGSNTWTTNTNGAADAANRYWKYTLSDGKYKINNQGKHKNATTGKNFLSPGVTGEGAILYADKQDYTQWSLVPAYKAALIGRMNQYYAAYIQDKNTAEATALKTSLEEVYNTIKDIQVTSESDYNTYFGQIQKAVAKVNANEVLVNPGFESCSIAGWTNGETVALGQLSSAPANNPKTGRWFVEKWAASGAIDFNQTTPVLPAGKYAIGVRARNDADALVYIYGNESQTALEKSNTKVYTTEVYLKEDGAIRLGVKCENHPANTWFALDDFTLEYLGNKIDYAVTELPNTDVTEGDWYSYAINVAGDYKVTSSSAATIKYVQDGNLDPTTEGTSLVFEAGETKIVSALTVGTLYVHSNAATTITVVPNTMSYAVGSAVANVTSVQSGKIVTISYTDATTNDDAATFAINGTPAITFAGNPVTVTPTANGFSFTVPAGVEVASNYTLSIPADAFGYEAGNTYNEAQNIEFTSPAILDQIAYIFNPKTEKFVSRGDAYGTAAFLDDYGIPVEIVTDGNGNTTFKFIDNQLYLYNDNWAYTDGTARNYSVSVASTANYSGYTFVSNNMPFYVNGVRCANNGIKDDNYTDDDLTIWQIKTKEERDAMKAAKDLANIVEVAEKAGETVASLSDLETILGTKMTTDQTSKVQSASLKSGIDGWTATSSGGGDYSTDQNVVEFYQSAEKITQTVSNLEQGIYKVTLNGFFRAGSNANCVKYSDYDISNAYLKANDYQVNLKTWASERTSDTAPNSKSEANAKFTNGGYLNTLYTYVGDDGNLDITIENPNNLGAGWMIFNNLTLTYYGGTAAVQTDYDNLAEAIEAAESKTLGFAEGEYAPYTNIAPLQALKAAKSIDTESTNLQLDVQAATQALNSATWTANTEEMNAVYDGTFAKAENNGAPAGWTMSNNTLGGSMHSRAFVGDDRLSEFGNTSNSAFFIRFDGTNSNRGSMYYYGNTDGYTMPLKANTTYYVSVDFAGWGSTGKPLRLNVTGPEGFTAMGNTINTSVKADTEEENPQNNTIVFTTGPAGNYVINFQTPGADTNTHNVVVSNIELKKVVESTLNLIAKSEAGTYYATFSSDKPVEFKNAVVYTVEAEGENLTLTSVADNKVPANTGVLIKTENATETYSVAASADALSNNMLKAASVKMEEGYSFYKLAYDNYSTSTGLGFYYGEENGAAFTCKAGTAYLAVPASSPVKSFVFDEDATAIKSVTISGIDASAPVYNTAGQRVSANTKGIVIQNGKKYFNK